MRREDLIDEFGKIDERIINSVSETRKIKNVKNNNKKIMRRIIAVAACICLVLSGLYFTPMREIIRKTAELAPGSSQSGNTDVTKNHDLSPFLAFAVEEAVYPSMPQYPVNINDSNYDEFQVQYDEWSKFSREKGGLVREHKYAIDSFVEKSIDKLIKSGSEGENIVCSPLNLYITLSVLAEATDSESRSQILELLCVDSIDELKKTVSAFFNGAYCDDSVTKTILANSLWLNDKTDYNEETVKLLAEKYFASTFRGEMGSDEYNEDFSKWLSSQTDGLLDKYIGEAKLTDDVILAIASTLCFEAKWDVEFDKSLNTEKIFHSLKGDEKLEFMNSSNDGLYYFSDKFSATEQYFDQNNCSMWFIRPDDGVKAEELFSDSEFINLLTHKKLPDSKVLKINLSVPKFDVSSDVDMKEAMENLGVTYVFNGEKSDFSPIIKTPGVYVNKFTHAAGITVDEKGCRASAFSTMMECGAGMPSEEEIDFVLDKPFIVLITGTNGLPLFVGIVNNI